jgi:hypothetical protein
MAEMLLTKDHHVIEAVPPDGSLPGLLFPWEGPTETALDPARSPKLPTSSSRRSRRAKW